ncbi:DUF1501 domain-containing protein [uncultured Cocleimonas sp.]|uniref:DUF1501 domain-containing protein n=1 Tax=uncultured Cocleimonas sp. TaxID=1051587 RepID=UPI00260C6F74|nr:DUF1501 domain-containing protein [uncultured Cocleimonas sp.]
MKNSNNISRRSFLKRAGASALTTGSLKYTPLLSGTFLGTGLTSSVAAADCDLPQSLVCVFLLGGADSFNFVVPTDSAYDQYAATRGAMAVNKSDLLASTDATQGEFGFNSRLSGLHDLYENDRLAVVSNVGNLIQPTTKADFNASTTLPQSLFAHDAQQKLWQTGSGNLADAFGWGGSIAERIANCNATSNVATSISINGSNSWLNNLQQNYVQLNANANIQRMVGYNASSSTQATLEALIAASKADQAAPFKQQLAHAITRANDTANSLSEAINDHPVSSFSPAGDLQRQLHLVARMISAREQLNMGKQVFFVGLGGWDTHSNQNVRMIPLMTELNAALTSFQTAIDDMGKADSVTTFTASDFGRTLTTNGDGTDHGWGGHSLVLGNKVKGGQIYGAFPSFASQNNPDDAGDDENFAGRIIPTTSVAQYGATLADWMGVSAAEQQAMLPNLANFSQKNLGFMKS